MTQIEHITAERIGARATVLIHRAQESAGVADLARLAAELRRFEPTRSELVSIARLLEHGVEVARHWLRETTEAIADAQDPDDITARLYTLSWAWAPISDGGTEDLRAAAVEGLLLNGFHRLAP